ncbi:hypothetical protein B296_00002552 [Ensete ventricosum]|uniref:Uncharacterized protein n=1 Tax=Ensete ventricosum TaxID=4639 RepID=A0A426ZQ65_ENSVE|nr:hypothetical protein B296_00002552 [Ensete ventricosum]
MANPLRERHHEDKQATKNAYCTKIEMAKFELRLGVEVRGIANSKDLVLMQGLVHGRRNVRGHPKARSELGAMEHQNFLFGMERIRP